MVVQRYELFRFRIRMNPGANSLKDVNSSMPELQREMLRRARAAAEGRIDPDVLRSGDPIAIGNAMRRAAASAGPSLESRFRDYRNSRDIYNREGATERAGMSQPGTFQLGMSQVHGPPMIDPFVLVGGGAASTSTPSLPEDKLNDFEHAGAKLYDGKPDEAIVLLRAYTQANPDDAEATRALALALIDARRTSEGVELMGQVYSRRPALASIALPPDAVGTETEMRDLVVRVVEHAHKVNTPAAWVSVAVLMQAEGRDEPAFKMIERADACGLSSDVSREMRAALRP